MLSKVLLIAEAANPEWVSVPLIGWSLAQAIGRSMPTHLVTQIRNRPAILRQGLAEGADFTVINSEAVARPLWLASRFIRGNSGVGWTTETAFAALSYYYFEYLVWQRLGPAIQRKDFRLIHRITPLSPTIPSILAQKAERSGVPFVIGPLNGGVPWPKAFNSERRKEREWLSYFRSAHKLLPGYGSTLKSASALIVGSRNTLNQVPESFRNKCVYLPENGIDPSRFSQTATQLSSRLSACFVGRLVPYKGPDMLIEALAPLLRGDRLRLDIIGDGPLMMPLRDLIRRESVERSVTLHGWIDHHQLQRVMIRSQLFTFPSIREFGGGVVLEAMALGLVPIVVDYGGPGELVNDQVGFKIPIGTRREIILNFRNAVERICERPEEIAERSTLARKITHSSFSWKAKAEQVTKVYEWVLGSRSEIPVIFN